MIATMTTIMSISEKETMRTKELKQLIGDRWEDFQHFMIGQAYGLECGGMEWTPNYYETDVKRFLRT